LNHMSLDGVIQSPGRPDEDTRRGFAHGGWSARYGDEVMMRWIGPIGSREPGAMLMGRISYEGMLGHWNRTGGPFKDALNAAQKYVASSDPSTVLEWPNSTLLRGDVPAAVAALKQEQEGPLLIMGSGALIHSLIPNDLIDEYRLAIYPLLLGGGVRLFPDGGMSYRLELVESITSTTGVLLTTYRPLRDVALSS
ncbi:MAG TPA: dihydrofolate reductase family protein, partial [Candidatus Dormibacteraeota bacterium]|nr:dihydrofolate reductase family protein [Candidatus Dormibacteraeota bacterium]